MPALAQVLSTTTPVSPLIRKARRLGISGINALISLAVTRGCRHYASLDSPLCPLPSRAELSDAELTTLLIVGENPYEPTAIRCAAQLARSPNIQATDLARLAKLEKTERVLSHIARAGLEHDPDGRIFWQHLLSLLPDTLIHPEPHLPHWSRFVSMPGRQRGGTAPTRWLTPDP